ncbi:DeoR/GlpR family DNA-binding transcription regulator [Verminephrobacter eiseniae]|uniref:Transcriptional regulator, DeoR family n=1 Tax=Verminephrobacter eiseniae (strain EF01-2) TaxID=391735 RepID=A1WFP4_VEREI|nr:DeoR/GlpR family DNA-binding transcription regulator [Verminephrobacter eiseniae]ABM56451.1 transcriptional regulator, DeoR family [Verminephrobacter eiseniae EF01-2]MCW5286812.1 DeoR/GlpR transcriptional regulator [Verminephrobacter eiseniae]MCW5305109.1 DeoR/GlpR transcriptional regulator [Verminephrobacter eiseniae]MCW8178941.1 DeoR/GlpR transcriptional regulator [Verminephrobacter eiseniae]MCW8191551.1 DeoR/GlpR transcriptional regulator [Verminephrobacter eiseniae]
MATQSRKSRRQEQILETLLLNPTQRVHQLAQTLRVSAETVRRDLAELAEGGKLSRTYGGALRTQQFEPALSERLLLKVRERQAIARQAAQRLGNMDVLMIGGGATTLHFARAIRRLNHPMTVITPAYSVAQELSRNPCFEVMCLPGIFEGKEGLVCGPEAIKAIERFHVPVAVLGASGVSREGVSEALLSAGQVYQAIMANSDQVFVLADGSKFNKRALTLLGTWQSNITLVTDVQPSGELQTAISQGRVLVEVATLE